MASPGSSTVGSLPPWLPHLLDLLVSGTAMSATNCAVLVASLAPNARECASSLRRYSKLTPQAPMAEDEAPSTPPRDAAESRSTLLLLPLVAVLLRFDEVMRPQASAWARHRSCALGLNRLSILGRIRFATDANS